MRLGWLREHSAVWGALAVGTAAVLSVGGLVVTQARLAEIDRADQPAAASTTSTSRPPATAEAASPSEAAALLAAMNRDREAAGVGALVPDRRLARAARDWSATMADRGRLEHQDLDAVLDLGFSTAGENILAGPPETDAAAVERAWMSSPPNRATVVNGAFTRAGVAFVTGDDGRAWITVVFAG